MHPLRLLVAIGLCLALGACVLWPSRDVAVPSIAGRVSDQDMPVVGAPVRIHGDGASREVVTDADGRFATPVVRRWTWWNYILGPADRPQRWQLQIHDGRDWRTGWTPLAMAPSATASMTGECDLGHDDDEQVTSTVPRASGMGICKLAPHDSDSTTSPGTAQ